MDLSPDAPVGHETTATATVTAETSVVPAVTAALPAIMAPAEPGMRPTGRRATAGVTIALVVAFLLVTLASL